MNEKLKEILWHIFVFACGFVLFCLISSIWLGCASTKIDNGPTGREVVYISGQLHSTIGSLENTINASERASEELAAGSYEFSCTLRQYIKLVHELTEELYRTKDKLQSCETIFNNNGTSVVSNDGAKDNIKYTTDKGN